MATTTRTHQRLPLGGFVFAPIIALAVGAAVVAGIAGNNAWEHFAKSRSVVTAPAADIGLSTSKLPLSDSEAYATYGSGRGEKAQALPLSDVEAYRLYAPAKAAGGLVDTALLSDDEAYNLFGPDPVARQAAKGHLLSDQEAWTRFGPGGQ